MTLSSGDWLSCPCDVSIFSLGAPASCRHFLLQSIKAPAEIRNHNWLTREQKKTLTRSREEEGQEWRTSRAGRADGACNRAQIDVPPAV